MLRCAATSILPCACEGDSADCLHTQAAALWHTSCAEHVHSKPRKLGDHWRNCTPCTCVTGPPNLLPHGGRPPPQHPCHARQQRGEGRIQGKCCCAGEGDARRAALPLSFLWHLLGLDVVGWVARGCSRGRTGRRFGRKGWGRHHLCLHFPGDWGGIRRALGLRRGVDTRSSRHGVPCPAKPPLETRGGWSGRCRPGSHLGTASADAAVALRRWQGSVWRLASGRTSQVPQPRPPATGCGACFKRRGLACCSLPSAIHFFAAAALINAAVCCLGGG